MLLLARNGLAFAAFGVCLSACATASQLTPTTWVSRKSVDQFTDAGACTVEPRQAAIAGDMSVLSPAYNLAFFPFVEKRSGEVRVGMRSFGRIAIPAGKIQLRIDDHDAWVIDTSETPVDSAGVDTSASTAAAVKGMTPEQAKAYAALSSGMSTNMNQLMSPYTATTGERAAAILQQMRTGRMVIYRRVGSNAAASSTGSVALGPDFLMALTECGIS